MWLPPPAECIRWIEELDQMYSAELLLKMELLESMDMHRVEADTLLGVAHLWALQPNIRPDALTMLRHVVSSLTLE